MKEFFFIMQLLLPDGSGPPPVQKPMATMEACLSEVAGAQAHAAEQNETFTYMAGCVQVSTKANPA